MVTLTSDHLLAIITELDAPGNPIPNTKIIKLACLRAEILIVPFLRFNPAPKGSPKMMTLTSDRLLLIIDEIYTPKKTYPRHQYNEVGVPKIRNIDSSIL